jgi:predicted dehydrogenase
LPSNALSTSLLPVPSRTAKTIWRGSSAKGKAMRKHSVAIIGLGAASLPHAKSLLDLSGQAEVVVAASRSEARLRAFAEHFPFPVTADISAVIADAAIDAVLLLTPPGTHLELAERCFASGKHVLVEKPLEISSERARRLAECARVHDRRLGVVLQHRFRPGSLRLREILASGELGSVEAASMMVPWWRPQSYYDEPGRGTMARDGGGVLLTQAIHTLDLFRSLVGVRRVEAAQVITTAAHRMETEDYASALVRLGNGAPGVLTATTAACPGVPERIEVIGAKGTAWLAGGSLRVAYHDGREERHEAEGPTGAGANIMDFPHDAHRALIADFLEAIRESRDPAVTGEDALATQMLIDAILAKGGAEPGTA